MKINASPKEIVKVDVGPVLLSWIPVASIVPVFKNWNTGTAPLTLMLKIDPEISAVAVELVSRASPPNVELIAKVNDAF